MNNKQSAPQSLKDARRLFFCCDHAFVLVQNVPQLNCFGINESDDEYIEFVHKLFFHKTFTIYERS